MLRFLWNGIKDSGGKLQRCSYSLAAMMQHPVGTVTVYARDRRFSEEVRAAFTVENDTDLMADYFDKDRFLVTPDHPLYTQVQAAVAKREAHYNRRFPD